MEASSKLDDCITDLAESSQIIINKISWPHQDKVRFADYTVDLSIAELQTHGRGTAKDDSEAIRMAFAEAFERLIVKEHRLPTSNGCAVYYNQETANEKAKLELIERDCFLRYFHLGYNFKKIQLAQKTEMTEYLNLLGIRFSNFKLFSDQQLIVCMTCISHRSGLFLGLGTNTNIEASLNKSMIEAFRQFIYFSNKKPLKSYFKNFDLLKNYSFDNHGDLLRDRAYLSKAFNFFKSSTINKIAFPNDGIFLIKHFSSHILQQVPLFFSQATNSNLLTLNLGPTTNTNNLHLIETQNSKSNTTINMLPHPLR